MHRLALAVSETDDAVRAATQSPPRLTPTDVDDLGALARECVADLPHPAPIDIAAEESADLRVLFMGRTQAGKSTLLETFTRGTGERIGDGSQRFSRDVETRSAATLPGIVVVDPPGVGASDGQHDRDLAFAEVPSADLIVWVASNDSTQASTATALRELGAYGKPLIVVLNCRWDLDDDFRYHEFLADPSVAFEDHEGHIDVVTRHLAQAGVRPVGVVMVHAQAAFLATQMHGANSRSLQDASRLATLNALLIRERDSRADQRKALKRVDQVRLPTIRYLAALSATALSLKVYTERGEAIAKDLSQRLTREADRQDELLTAELDAILQKRRTWHTHADIDEDLNKAWAAEVERMQEEMNAAVRANRDSLAKKAEEATATVRSDWETIPLQGDLGSFTDFGSVWTNRAGLTIAGLGKGYGAYWAMGFGMKMGAALGAKWGGVLGTAEGPIGVIAGVTIGAAIGAIIGVALTAVQRVWEGLFVGKAEVNRRRREELRKQIHPHLDAISKNIHEWRQGQTAQIHEGFAKHFATIRSALRHEHEVLRAWTEAGDDLDAQVADLDTHTARTLLALTGRRRLAADVTRARRQQGTAVAVEYSSRGFAEAALFPPVDTCETLLAAGPPKAQAAAAQALSLALALTPALPKLRHVGQGRADLHFDEPIPAGLTGSWALLLSTFTGRPVTITAPPPPSPTSPQENPS
ncbi:MULTISPECIES: GTPase [unclassified Knoellia]|uniref:GTPase n=1 Tax=Knoellia altitudinis TaxID=3404795 RepID=UPI0036229D2C